MATLNIKLPDDVKAFVEDQAEKNGFETVSDYVTAMIRNAQEREAARDGLDALLIDGLDSGPATPLTAKDWEHLREEGKKLIAERKKKRE
jgi:antitoxin ParD1/3/4